MPLVGAAKLYQRFWRSASSWARRASPTLWLYLHMSPAATPITHGEELAIKLQLVLEVGIELGRVGWAQPDEPALAQREDVFGADRGPTEDDDLGVGAAVSLSGPCAGP